MAISHLMETQENNEMVANVQRDYAYHFIDPAVPPREGRAHAHGADALAGQYWAFSGRVVHRADSPARPREYGVHERGPMASLLTNASMLITGGTGSFGDAFVPMTLAKYNPRRLVIFSRDEMKQWEMAKLFGRDERVRFFIGDVRDKDRLGRAMDGIDFVVHAAATKSCRRPSTIHSSASRPISSAR